MEKLRKFETEEQYLNEKESLEYPSVSLTADNEKVWVKENLGSFEILIDNSYYTFYFKKGMAWNDFINSKYNVPTCSNDEYDATFYYFENSKEIQMCRKYEGNEYVKLNHKKCLIDDLLIDGGEYEYEEYPV